MLVTFCGEGRFIHVRVPDDVPMCAHCAANLVITATASHARECRLALVMRKIICTLYGDDGADVLREVLALYRCELVKTAPAEAITRIITGINMF